MLSLGISIVGVSFTIVYHILECPVLEPMRRDDWCSLSSDALAIASICICKGLMLSMASSAAVGVDFIAPVIPTNANLWTFVKSLWTLATWHLGHQITAAYVKIGLMIAV